MTALPEVPGLVVVLGDEPSVSETFLVDHLTGLPGPPRAIVGYPPRLDGRPVMHPVRRLLSAARRRLLPGGNPGSTLTDGMVLALRQARARVVLAEFGPVAVGALEACRAEGIPLVAHFHGFDASVESVLLRYRTGYRQLFEAAAGVVGVSRAMCDRLAAMGAPAGRLHCIPCGVDTDRFQGGQPGLSAPVFLSVGRLIAKKGPQHTIRAFALVHRECPEARLRLLGDGPLRPECEALVASLGLGQAVAFLGAGGRDRVVQEMREARAFVQHSVVAPNGDREGTPVSAVEAASMGLPIVCTRHEGLVDVVVDGATGWLVEEGDVTGMARHMAALATDAGLAQRLGAAGRAHALAHFRREDSLARLAGVLARAADG